MVHYYIYMSTLYPASQFSSPIVAKRCNYHSFHVCIDVNEWSNCRNSFVVISMETFCATLPIKHRFKSSFWLLIFNKFSICFCDCPIGIWNCFDCCLFFILSKHLVKMCLCFNNLIHSYGIYVVFIEALPWSRKFPWYKMRPIFIL